MTFIANEFKSESLNVFLLKKWLLVEIRIE
jgi:hypothetical protein